MERVARVNYANFSQLKIDRFRIHYGLKIRVIVRHKPHTSTNSLNDVSEDEILILRTPTTVKMENTRVRIRATSNENIGSTYERNVREYARNETREK